MQYRRDNVAEIVIDNRDLKAVEVGGRNQNIFHLKNRTIQESGMGDRQKDGVIRHMETVGLQKLVQIDEIHGKDFDLT